MIPYRDLELPQQAENPFVYSNFVQTIDGKTQALTTPNRHWPIGSQADYRGLLELRARADVLVHGRKTADWVRTIDHMGKPEFQKLRARYGKIRPILYAVVSANPSEKVRRYLIDPPPGVETLLVTTRDAKLASEWDGLQVVRLDRALIKTKNLIAWLKRANYRSILVEGGPTLLRHVLDEDQLDDLFVTIVPKIYGGTSGETLGLITGPLYSATAVRRAVLKKVFAVGDELYVRYKIKKGASHAN